MAEDGGLVLRDDDGNVYFIGNEILEAAKLEGEHLVRATELLEAGSPEVEGFWDFSHYNGPTGFPSFPAVVPLWMRVSENLAPDPPNRRSSVT